MLVTNYEKRFVSCLFFYCVTMHSFPYGYHPLPQSTGWLLSSFPSLIRYKISYTQTILVIMVFRDCNSNILNDSKRFFESKTYNCVLYDEFCGENMCPGAQRNSRIRVTASVKNVSIIDVP